MPRTPRGVPIVFTRGRTAKERLRIDWVAPVYTPPEPTSQHTSSGRAGALSKDAALAFLRGKDKRPLLVLRECRGCRGSDLALLTKATNNDRTMLLTRWFQCVKLPASVREKRHPLHNLFAGDHPPHLFLATADGKDLRGLPGDQTQSKVWKAMTAILRQSYRGDPGSAVKQLLVVLNKFDVLDAKEATLRRRLDATLESRGPRSARFKQLRTRFNTLQKQRKALLARERKLGDLDVR